MRRNPLLVIATMLAVLVSSFLVFTTLSARAIVENNTSRWQNGVHVVIFLDDRVTSTAHQQLQETLESYSEVRMVEYFSKSEATEEFKTLFQDQPELVQEVDFDILPTSLRINLNDPADYELIIERMDGNPAVKEIRASGEAIERLLTLTNTIVLSATIFAVLIAFAAFVLIINTLRLTAYAKRKEIKNTDTAIIRIEQLYPFPNRNLERLINNYKNVNKYIWVQEEPKNMGPWFHVMDHFRAVKLKIKLISREESASPASGSSQRYYERQQKIINEVFSITLEGAVISPGIYGAKQGEKLSDIIRRAGGYKPNAYTYGAVLARRSVAEKEKIAFCLL